MKKIKTRKQKIKQIKNIMILLILVISLFNLKLVDAGINDSKIEKNKVEGIYAATNINGQDHLYYLNMYTLNGITSYCIEIGVDITTEIYNSTYDFNISNLNNTQINYVRNLSYFGYGYKNHTDQKYYMATQELIWEYLNNIQVEWTNTLDINGPRINIDSYKNEIITLVNEYNKGVNLENYSNNKEVIIGDILTINDLNKNLKYYDVLSGNHNTVTVENNQINIKFDTNYTGKDTIILKRKNIYNHSSLLYYQNTSQKLISNGNIDEKITLSFIVNGKTKEFQLIDSIDIKPNNQYSYKGIVFELYNNDNELIKEIESNESGILTIPNLVYGNYYLKQTKTNEAYKPKDDYYYFEYKGENNIDQIPIEPITNTYEFLKLFGENDNLKTEESIIFNIYNKDETLYESITTNNQGIATIKLPYGSYIVKQQNTTDGYYKVNDFNIDVLEHQDEIIKHTLIDNNIKVDLEIKNIDEENKLILENTIYYKVKDKSTNEYINSKGEIEFPSVNGNIIIPVKLNYGEYEVEVVNKSKNYKEVYKKIDVLINTNSDFKTNGTRIYIELNYKFKRIKGNINIKTLKEKMYIENNNYYYKYINDSNVNLKLFANDDIKLNNETIYQKGDLIQEITTNNDGEFLINDLYLGNYCLKADNDYENCFEVVDEEEVKITIKKSLDKGGLIIHNISNNTENIKDTIIELYDKDNNLIQTGSTNEEGIIKINDLKTNEYCIKQKKIDNIYELNKETLCFNIEKDKITKIEIINNKKNRSIIQVPNTLNDKKSIKKLIILSFLIIGVVLYKTKINNNN